MTEMRINTFIYEECIKQNVPLPTLPVLLQSTFGQCGEDLIVASLLKALAKRTGKELENMTFLEIGGNCPVSTSATFLLANELNMRGVIVEANPSLIDNLRRVRKDSEILNYAVTAEECGIAELYISEASELSSLWEDFVKQWPGDKGKCVIKKIKVPAITLTQIMEKYFTKKELTFLSLDIEGMDLLVLQSLDLNKHRPCIIQIEPSEHFIELEGEKINNYLCEYDYTLMSMTAVNSIYIDCKI